ncbi:MAG: hypothetical protein GY708_27420, partial [Actinomycetia bacterium]|nr:hypothetical protein [Actinomycetes bacterium]
MADLETLLGEARRKSAAETDATQLRSMLNRLDSELVELNEVRQQVSRRAARSGGLMGRFRRDRGDPQVDEMELMRVDASIAALESRRASGQHRLRTVEQEAHGAELARAMLGAEMTRRTSALAADDPSLARLAEIDERREGLVQRRDRATSMSALAGELLLWVDGAERADDGTDV